MVLLNHEFKSSVSGCLLKPPTHSLLSSDDIHLSPYFSKGWILAGPGLYTKEHGREWPQQKVKEWKQVLSQS